VGVSLFSKCNPVFESAISSKTAGSSFFEWQDEINIKIAITRDSSKAKEVR
jgi:hypothetical protein